MPKPRTRQHLKSYLNQSQLLGLGITEKQLDHKDRDQVRAADLRTNFLEQRAPMMQWFADWCVGEETATNVIPLRSS